MSNDRDRLLELLHKAPKGRGRISNYELANYLLANGVIVQQQGKWKIKRDECDFEYMMCSCCKEEFFPEGCVVEIKPNFCPNCGANMKEREG